MTQFHLSMDWLDESVELTQPRTIRAYHEPEISLSKSASEAMDNYESQHPSQEPGGTDLKPNTEGIHQELSHLQQEKQQQQGEKTVSPINPGQQDDQENSLSQIQKDLNSEQVQKFEKLQRHQNCEVKILEGRELQIKVNHEPNIQKNQEPQNQENQKPHRDESRELQSQQISSLVQITQLLSTPKQSTQHQKQANNHQPLGKKSQHWHKEQQLKKRKKKLVGENQERINFLVQASRAVALTSQYAGAVHSQRALAAQLGSLAGAVGRRCVLRLAPALKRCLCKGCGTALVYGVNAKVRHRSNRQKHLVVTCLTCHTIKRFLNNPRHELWFEQEEAVV